MSVAGEKWGEGGLGRGLRLAGDFTAETKGTLAVRIRLSALWRLIVVR